MPAGYRITALKKIATQNVRDDIEREERRLRSEGLVTDPGHVYERLLEYAMQMSADKFVENRDLAEAKTPVNKANKMMGDQSQVTPPGLGAYNVGPGKGQYHGGKSGFKGGFGFGNTKGGKQGWQMPKGGFQGNKGGFPPPPTVPKGGWGQPQGAKGFSGAPGTKGDGSKGGPRFMTPFYGTCRNCNRVGHSAGNCPDLGKGFSGVCHTCGVRGHPASLCPSVPSDGGKGGKSANSVEPQGPTVTMNLGGGEAAVPEENGGQTDASGANNIQGPPTQSGWDEQEWGGGPAWDTQWNNAYNVNSWDDPYAQYRGGWEPIWGRPVFIVTRDETPVGDEGTKKQEVLNVQPECIKHGDDKYEWIKEEAVLDSGCMDILGPKRLVNPKNLRPTALSQQGKGYTAADQGAIKNLGEGDLEAVSETGMGLNCTAQIGDKLNRLLIGLSRAAEAGNAVLFNVDRDFLNRMAKERDITENMIVDKKTLARDEVKKKNGIYVYPMWVKREKRDKVISGAKHFPVDFVEEDESKDPWDLF